ncbi:hypothetical protein F5Y17DRAFT_196692 [Xylariaceae sp. FL0594]|nr:hypothetical protein F5Y17DRAFT_196692 [Xylariaceae sp. FL0594]
MAGPRVTGPVTKLARSISTTTQGSTLLTSSKASAPLSRKYAELLKDRNIDIDHPRHIYTRSSNPPYPQPRKLRLMQTFSTRAAAAPEATAQTIDQFVFPGSAALKGASGDPFTNLRVPLLPDNVEFQHTPEVQDAAVTTPEISIVAANLNAASPAALTEIEGMGADGVELQFVHEAESSSESQNDMLTGLWNMVDDVFGQQTSKAKLAI